MAITLANLRTAVRRMADMESSQFVTDAEVNDYINRSAAYWHNVLSSRHEDYFITFTTVTVPSGSNTITLPVDCFKLRGLDYQNGSSAPPWRTLQQFSWNERNSFSQDMRVAWGSNPERRYRIMGNAIWLVPETAADGTYRLWYTRLFAPMITDTDSIADWQGWHELVIVDAAIKCLRKEESDVSSLEMEREKIEARITESATNRNEGDPQVIEDVQGEPAGPFGWGGT